LLTPDARFAPREREPLWAVRIDHRGLPIVNINPISERLHSPFADNDGDGLADVGTDGWFIDVEGTSLDGIVAFGEPNTGGLIPRDALGRAQYDGELVFDYVDLNQTAMAYLLRESNTFVSQEVFFDLVLPLDAVLPARTEMLDDDGRAYMGYPEDHPLMDLAWAVLDLGAYEGLDEVLEMVGVVLREHDGVFAELLLSFQVYDDLRSVYPEAELKPDSTLVDDILPPLAEIVADPGLVEDLLTVLTEEVTLVHEQSTTELLTYRAQNAIPSADDPYEACFATCADLPPGTVERVACITACPRDAILQEPVDRTAPPSAVNRSLLERTLALMREAEGIPMEVKVVRL
ncbi:MAG: hypothetical protein AAFX99_36770, partial [Myxococcota bacterium]